MPTGRSAVNDVQTSDNPGEVTRAEVADQNIDLYIISQDNGSAHPLGLSVNSGASLSDIYFPPAAADPANAKGFTGNDGMAPVEGRFVHRFSAGDTGQYRRLECRLEPGEAGWVMVLDTDPEY
jgi:hypothetical protein